MLSGKSNAVERGKTAIGLISKKATLHVQHTFFCTFICLCFALLQCETSGNFLVTGFMEEKSYLFSFTFFTAAHFHLAFVAACISYFVTAATKFFCCSFNKKMPPLFFFLHPRSLSPFFSRWASLACSLLLFFPVFLCFYIPNLWTWQDFLEECWWF